MNTFFSTLPPGPWDAQPQAVAWKDAATGLHCLILKTEFGTLNGYVRVMRTHPLHRATWHQLRHLRVHGGVTFARHMSHRRHMKRGFWIGFDCAHWGDINPLTESLLPHEGRGRYSSRIWRNGAYVKNQVELLAKQLRAKP